MRTLSKFGLAGVRLGYMAGHADLIAQVDKVRPPYNVSVLNAEAALFALEHAPVFDAQAQTIKSERERLQVFLARQLRCEAFPSQANMILVRVPDAAAVFQALKTRGILIKNVSGLHELLANCVRLTVGTPAENDALMVALSDILS
jgi:histidinol-phosphate aminotransferase